MRSFITWFALVLFSPVALAVSESDFAYGYTLEVDGDGAIYSLSLPESVYRGLTRADEGDLRVFNSNGVSVPHHIQRSEQTHKTEQADVKLPMFPLYRDRETGATEKAPNVHIVTDDKGAIIDINYGKVESEDARQVSAYVLDGSQLQNTPNALLLDWPAELGDFVANVSVEGSDDLTHWSLLLARSTLSNLHYAGHALVQKRIDLPMHKYKYLRLNFMEAKAVTLDTVMAQFPASYQSQERKWTSFDSTSIDSSSNTYYFDTHSMLPADRLNISLPDAYTLVQGVVESASSVKGPWYQRYSGLLYRLRYESSQLATPDQSIPVTTQRYWRLRLLGQEVRLDGKPRLRLGWIPETLYFIAQGEAPFTLAYGSARVGPVNTPLKSLMTTDHLRNQLGMIKPAQLGSPIELGNKDKLRPATPPPDWKKILLWLILIFGVAALSYMAMRLYKQMDRTGPSE